MTPPGGQEPVKAGPCGLGCENPLSNSLQERLGRIYMNKGRRDSCGRRYCMLELEGREWRVTVETGILSEPLLQDCRLEKQVLPLSHPAPQRVILFLNLSHCLLFFFF